MQTTTGIDEILAVTATILLETQCINQCVAGSGIALNVLQKMGHGTAYPLTVGVRITNPAQSSTGIMLGKGATASQGEWAGHLVVIVRNYEGSDHLLVDLTIVQVNGKVPGIVLTPFLGLVDDAFIEGSKPASFLDNGCNLEYSAYPHDDSYLVETNWLRIPGLDNAVEMVLDRLA